MVGLVVGDGTVTFKQYIHSWVRDRLTDVTDRGTPLCLLSPLSPHDPRPLLPYSTMAHTQCSIYAYATPPQIPLIPLIPTQLFYLCIYIQCRHSLSIFFIIIYIVYIFIYKASSQSTLTPLPISRLLTTYRRTVVHQALATATYQGTPIRHAHHLHSSKKTHGKHTLISSVHLPSFVFSFAVAFDPKAAACHRIARATASLALVAGPSRRCLQVVGKIAPLNHPA